MGGEIDMARQENRERFQICVISLSAKDIAICQVIVLSMVLKFFIREKYVYASGNNSVFVFGKNLSS